MLVLLLCVVVGVVLFAFVSVPILRLREAESVPGLPSSHDWQMNAVLQQIKEIELDFHAGKISSQDHALLRKFYEVKAAELLAPKKQSA